MVEKQPRVAIIGGGVTGLTTAFYLNKFKEESNTQFEFAIYESEDRLGGKMQTIKKDGFVIERGPDSYLARKEAALRLVQALGIKDQLVRNETGKAYVLLKNKLHPIPDGAAMGIPTKISPFITTGMFSWPGKIRASFDFFLPRSSSKDKDQSLGTFFRYRFGDEVVENLIEPLLSGIYAGDIDNLSLMSTFPQYYHVEQKYRCLIYGMKKAIPQPKLRPGVRKPGIFQTLNNGLESIAEAIEKQLPAEVIFKGKNVTEIIKVDEEYEISFADGSKERFDYVVITTPHQITNKILHRYDAVKPLAEIPSTSVATVALAFPENAIKEDLDGTGFVVSRNADYTITACTWTHKKWPHTTPEGYVLLRTYVGRANDSSIVYESDETIVNVVLNDLKKIMKFDDQQLLFSVVSRWKESMPQYTVGHKDRIDAVRNQLKAECPGITLTGATYEGIGVPDCIEQGENTVKELKAILSKYDYARV